MERVTKMVNIRERKHHSILYSIRQQRQKGIKTIVSQLLHRINNAFFETLGQNQRCVILVEWVMPESLFGLINVDD